VVLGIPYGSNTFWVETGFRPLIDPLDIEWLIAGLDAVDSIASDLMGWEFTAATALDHKRALDGNRACASVGIPGVGTLGWGIGPSDYQNRQS
jgi:hypothetical protein